MNGYGHFTMRAGDVKVGDRLYWSLAFGRDKFVPVTAVRPSTRAACDVVLECAGYGSTIKHKDEGVAVRRDEE